ncbi:class I SAM-dependent methyltransferase [Ureaplasma miroungigenitalium]|uniref:Class I SAM-dependent methyltransferase n=1 Tax=Ureaplasma miroungigenitalium TaxID=1042321 RepID=A0ABT3BMW1_9BACT|nr:class I SAM-dependent methyltransferase [Ureaplasma miroungigenitalium]MCV3728594.1 class I SAM-dependent methyltransferase [Ureaplasma miroungigenitalium]MCV3734399.1 class I SAM-dependent methyltransferase [Ureaplasma miroungigenitalium]
MNDKKDTQQRFDYPQDDDNGKEMLLKMNANHKHISDFFFENVNILPTDICLDIGCGGGYNAGELAKRAFLVHAIDISKKACEVTRFYNTTAYRSQKLLISNTSIEDIEFPNEYFSVITAFSTIYFWDDLDNDLKKIYNFLKKDGAFYIMIATNKDHWQDQWKHVNNFKVMDEYELLAKLRAVGFNQLNIKYQPNTMRLMIRGVK